MERERERVANSGNFPRRHKILFGVVVAIGIITYAGFNLWVWRYTKSGSAGLGGFQSKSGRSIPTPAPTPTPTPKPIPTGKQSFTVSSGKKTGPQFSKGEINPYDPPKGTHQLWTVSVKSEKPVTKASLTLTTDTMAKTLPLELKEGSPTDGLWTATWIANDSYLYTYLAKFTATDGSEENTVELTLR